MAHLSGKIIVVTGGSGGIGKYICDSLAPRNTVVSLSRSGEGTNAITCDVSDSRSVESAFTEIKAKYGRVDVLVNNAGYGLSGAIELAEESDVEKLIQVDFMGVFRCAKAALPIMEKGGRIVNISSACAIFPLPFRGFYCAVKAAVSMLSHALRAEAAPYGIDVTAICPGDIKTGFSAHRVKNYATTERYGGRVKAADERIAKREDKRMELSSAGAKIVKIVEKRRYKPFYIVGGKYKALYACYKLLPLGLILKATGGIMAPADKK